MSKYLFTKPEPILAALEQMESPPVPSVELTPEFLDTYIKLSHDMGSVPGPLAWDRFYLLMGSIGIQLYNLTVPSGLDHVQFSQFLLSKHLVYGLEPLLVVRTLEPLVRIAGKLWRVKNQLDPSLSLDELSGTVESITRELEDVVGYCVLGYYLALGGYYE